MLSSPRPAVVVLAVLGALATLGTALQALPASAQISRNVTLLSHMDLYDEYFACWSYVHEDGREYAVILTTEGASIVRLTDPANPVEVGFIQAQAGLVPGIGQEARRAYVEAKQYRNYIYLVTELTKNFDPEADPNDTGMALIDMRDPDHPHKVSSFVSPIVSAHTITIDPSRALLFANGTTSCNADFTVCENSLQIFSIVDPEHPVLLSSWPGYVHDTHVRGNRAYFSMIFEDLDVDDPTARHAGGPGNEGILIVVDLTDPTHPVELARIHTDRTFQHSSWTSEDGRYLYAANEVQRDGLTVWDLSNLADIEQVFTFEDLPVHVVHQPHVIGNTLNLTYYSAGVRLMDLRNPAWPVEYGFYDTYDGFNGNYTGAWECAPYYPSGIFVVSDIQSGLWVFRATPSPYGIVRGTIREFANGPVIPYATVTVQPSGMTVKSGKDGRYAFALSPGTSTVSASMYAFESASATVGVVNNADHTLDLALRPLPTGTLSGTVRSAAGAAMANADVDVLGTPHRASTDASGTFSIPGIPEGTYSVRAARPGFAASAASVSVPKGKVTTRNLTLGGVATYDNLETERGWVPSVASTFSGAWVRAVPVQKVSCDEGTEFQPGVDRTPDPGATCLVTSNVSIPCCGFCGAVTFGIRTVTSPPLALSGVSDPRIGYWFHYVNHIPRVPDVNPFLVLLSNDGGATWVTAKTILTSTYRWQYDEVRVTDFFANPGQVLVQFAVQNVFQSVDATPEAAVDDIMVYSGNGSGSAAPALASASTAPAFAVSAPRPSPTHGATEIELALNRDTHVRADVFDLHGRLVTTALNRTIPSGRTMLRWDGKTRTGEPVASGVYWLALRAGEEERRIRLVVVR